MRCGRDPYGEAPTVRRNTGHANSEPSGYVRGGGNLNRVNARARRVTCPNWRSPAAGLAGLLPMILAGCGSGSPSLTVVTTLDLQETDSVYLANPASLWANSNGDFVVADRGRSEVLIFDRSGGIRRRLGRSGPGPGEFTALGPAFAMGDSMIGAVDYGKGAIQLFRTITGNFVRSRSLDAMPLYVVDADHAILFGAISRVKRKGVVRWDLRRDSMDYLVELPLPYRRNRQLAETWPMTAAVPRQGRFVVGFGADPAVMIIDTAGEVQDSFEIPVRKRRGVPSDLERLVDPTFDMEQGKLLAMTSVLLSVGALSDGSLVFVHFDPQVQGRTAVAAGYVTVVAPDLSRACVDGVLQADDEPIPVLRFRGDTLFAIRQRVDSTSRASSAIVGYLIDTKGCRWVTVGHKSLR